MGKNKILDELKDEVTKHLILEYKHTRCDNVL